MESYLTYEEYVAMGGKLLPQEEAQNLLLTASLHINVLTHNKIQKIGFDNLYPNFREIVKIVCKNLVDFEYENSETLSAIYESYSINDVKLTFGGVNWNIHTEDGVVIKSDDYSLLVSTGLCYRGLY